MNIPFSTNTIRQLFNIGFIVNSLEWYEISIYAYLSPVMGKIFLQPTEKPTTALIQAWGIFAISYLARPLGAFFWGYIGDRIGRRIALQHSLLVMAIPTALIGMLPTYEHIGFLATLILLILRFIQGFAAGGENGLNSCYMYETAPYSSRGFFCSTVAVSGILGFLLGSFTVTILYGCFDHKIILSWAWRLPYLLSIPMSWWISKIRLSIQEHEVQVPIRSEKQPYLTLLLKSKLYLVIIFNAFVEASTHVIFLWMPLYWVYALNISTALAQIYSTIGLGAWAVFTFLAGYLSDILDYRKLILFYTVSLIFLSYPLFQWMQSGASHEALWVIYCLFSYFLGGMSGTQMQLLGDFFPHRVRAMGMSFTYSFAATFFGSITPLICTYFTQKMEMRQFPAFYIMILGCLAFVVILNLRFEKRRNVLS